MDWAFSDKEDLSIIIFLQNFKAACDSWKLHDSAVIRQSNQYLLGFVKAVIEAWVSSQPKPVSHMTGA